MKPETDREKRAAGVAELMYHPLDKFGGLGGGAMPVGKAGKLARAPAKGLLDIVESGSAPAVKVDQPAASEFLPSFGGYTNWKHGGGCRPAAARRARGAARPAWSRRARCSRRSSG